MESGQNAGAPSQQGDANYADRGADNMADMTRYDENQMDRTAQAGTTGAFGAAEGADQEQRRQDAEAAFGGADQGGQGGS